MFLTRRLLIVARFLLLLLLNIPIPDTAAQTCTPIYKKTYDGNGEDAGLDIHHTRDGGSIVAGITTSDATNTNGFLLKLSEQGNIEWVKSYGGSSYDEILRVKQTTDGGYVAIGTTRSFGNNAGDAWLLRTDPGGNMLWSRLLSNSGEPSRGKDVIELKDGGFAAVLNLTSAASKEDGVVLRSNALGTLLWSQRYDGGSSDSLNTIIEEEGYLVVTGNTTGANQDAVLMKISLSSGALIWAKKFMRNVGTSDEFLGVTRIAGGYAFGVASKYHPKDGSAYVALFKMRDDGTIFYSRRVSINTRTGYGLHTINLKLTSDNGFLFTANDTTPARNGVFSKMSAIGLSEWGQSATDYYRLSSINGIDNYGSSGYLATGAYTETSWPLPTSKVQVFKTNLLGKYGACSGIYGGNHTDTIHNFIIQPFSWSNTNSDAIKASLISPVTAALNFTTRTICEKQDCAPPATKTEAACYASFLYHYPGKLRSVPFDVQKTSDGYIMSGYAQRYSIVPYVVKLRNDGTVAWAKSPNNYIHEASIQMMRPTEDGNVLLIGPDGHTINHNSYTNTAIMKMSPGGQVLWSKYVEGSLFDLQPIGNGQFTGFLLYNLTTPPVSVARIIIDQAGTISYRKRLNSPYEYIPTYRKLIVEGIHFYAAGELNGSIVIDKLDTAGNRIWTRRFKPDNKLSDVEAFYIIGDSLYTALRVVTQVGWTYKNHIGLVKIGKDGGGLQGVTLNQPDIVPDGNNYVFWPQTKIIRVTKTADNNFVLADRIPNGSDSVIGLTKFSPSGEILWSKKFPVLNKHRVMAIKDDEGSLVVLGYKMLEDPDYGGNSSEPWLMRLSKTGEMMSSSLANCKAEPIVASATTMNVTEEFSFAAPKPTFSWTNFYEVSYSPIEQELMVGDQMSCGVPSDCSILSVNGKNSICNYQDTVVYHINKSPGCIVPVTWRFDTSFAHFVSFTDTTLSLRFKRPGMTKVYATYQTGCGSITDSLEVEVLLNAHTLNLGNDTNICTGNILLLAARKGYASYRWQDGSTDSTYTVREPGLYYVEVSDACGRSFADSVLVHSQPPIPFDLGPDRYKCNNDTVQLQAPKGFLSYSWSPAYEISSLAGSMVVVNPTTDTSYYVRAEKTPGCFAYDTVRVYVFHSVPVRLGADQSFCSGDSLQLNAGAGFRSYQWSTGEVSERIVVRNAGQYRVLATTAEGCTSQDTLTVSNVWPLPRIALDKSSELCLGATRKLEPGHFASYQWQDGSTASSFIIQDTGTYFVQVTDINGCVKSDTVLISTILPLPKDFLPIDTGICSYAKLTLKPLQNFSDYQWSNGSLMPSVVVERAGVYWLQVTDNKGCIGKDSITVQPRECMKGVYIPSAFTPERNGKNDVFRAMAFGRVMSFELTVYNRWGEVVFTTKDVDKAWDGSVKGKTQDTGVFVWICRFQLEGDKERFERGTVTLIR